MGAFPPTGIGAADIRARPENERPRPTDRAAARAIDETPTTRQGTCPPTSTRAWARCPASTECRRDAEPCSPSLVCAQGGRGSRATTPIRGRPNEQESPQANSRSRDPSRLQTPGTDQRAAQGAQDQFSAQDAQIARVQVEEAARMQAMLAMQPPPSPSHQPRLDPPQILSKHERGLNAALSPRCT